MFTLSTSCISFILALISAEKLFYLCFQLVASFCFISALISAERFNVYLVGKFYFSHSFQLEYQQGDFHYYFVSWLHFSLLFQLCISR